MPASMGIVLGAAALAAGGTAAPAGARMPVAIAPAVSAEARIRLPMFIGVGMPRNRLVCEWPDVNQVPTKTQRKLAARANIHRSAVDLRGARRAILCSSSISVRIAGRQALHGRVSKTRRMGQRAWAPGAPCVD